jgi:hypothetical protein
MEMRPVFHVEPTVFTTASETAIIFRSSSFAFFAYLYIFGPSSLYYFPFITLSLRARKDVDLIL